MAYEETTEVEALELNLTPEEMEASLSPEVDGIQWVTPGSKLDKALRGEA